MPPTGPYSARGPHGSGPRGPARPPAHAAPVLFDPAKPDVELFDTLAEQQAESFQQRINSSQLRRFFGEVKELHRQFETLVAQGRDPADSIYTSRIEPRFKMIRSKVKYASRRSAQGRVPDDFGHFLTVGIEKVRNHEDFRRFVLHFEAVVGFMYGSDKVGK